MGQKSLHIWRRLHFTPSFMEMSVRPCEQDYATKRLLRVLFKIFKQIFIKSIIRQLLQYTDRQKEWKPKTSNKESEKVVSVFLANRNFVQDSKQFKALGEITTSLDFAKGVPNLENPQLNPNDIIFESNVEIAFEIKNMSPCGD